VWGPDGFDPDVEGNWIYGITSNPYTLDPTSPSLTPNTDYDWYILTDCGQSGKSSLAGPESFTTLCEAISSFPFTEGFEGSTFPPDCWSNPDGLWYLGSEPNSGNNCAAASYIHPGEAILNSPPFDLPANHRMSFWWKDDDVTARVAGHDTTFFEISTDGGSTWTILDTLALPGNSATYIEAEHDLTAYGGGEVQFRWRDFNDGTISSWGVGLDDILIEEIPSCLPPTADSANNETLTSAQVYWTEAATATEWQVEFGPKGYTAGTGTKVSPTVTTGTDTTLNGLMNSTEYDWYVRAICAPGDTSLWSNAGSFTTACGPISTFPYTQNFDSWTTYSPPFGCTPDGSIALGTCWLNQTGDDLDWLVRSGSTGSSGTGPSSDHTTGSGNYIYTEASGCNSSTGAVLSPEFDFTGVFPKLSFWYHMWGGQMGTLSVQASTDGGSTWSADLWSLAGDQGNAWIEANIGLGAYAGESSVIFRFTGVTGIGFESDIAIDDVSITLITDPTFTFNPDSVNYGECPLNNFSSEYYTQEFVAQNIGPGTITVSSVSLTGADASEFTLIDPNSYPYNLTGSGTLVFEVQFDPTTVGSKTCV
jgi:hypothetical protein